MPTRPFSELAAEVKPSPVPAPIWDSPTVSELDMRAFKRLFGIPSPSLIHNGKKRRKR